MNMVRGLLSLYFQQKGETLYVSYFELVHPPLKDCFLAVRLMEEVFIQFTLVILGLQVNLLYRHFEITIYSISTLTS